MKVEKVKAVKLYKEQEKGLYAVYPFETADGRVLINLVDAQGAGAVCTLLTISSGGIHVHAIPLSVNHDRLPFKVEKMGGNRESPDYPVVRWL